MADDFESLSRRLDALAARAERNAEKAIRGSGLIADQVLVLGTPVDTGRARGGWIASHGKPVLEESGELDKGGANTLAKSQPVILSFRVGADLFIANVVPYIESLDRGHSPQNRDFVRAAVNAATAYIRRQRYLN